MPAHGRLVNPTTRGPRLGSLLVAAVISSAGPQPAAIAADLPAAEVVLERYAEAIGGDAVRGVRNMAAEFSFSMPNQGVYASGVQYRRAPADYYLRINLAASGVADFETGVSGDLAWRIHPMTGTSVLEGDEKRASLWSASINPFARWQDFFEDAKTVRLETVNGRSCHMVRFTAREGASLDAYFDMDSGLLVRDVVTGSGGAVITTDYDDWEESHGIRSPRSVRQKGLQSLRYGDFSRKHEAPKYDNSTGPSVSGSTGLACSSIMRFQYDLVIQR